MGNLTVEKNINYVKKNESTDYAGVFCVGAFNRNPISTENKDEFELWLKSVEKQDDNGFFLDMEEAKRVALEYRERGQIYDIVACIDVTEKDFEEDVLPSYSREFLGYDVSDLNCHSVIYLYDYITPYEEDRSALQLTKDNFLRILSLNFFSKKLNKNKLFQDYIHAKALLESELNISIIKPELNTLHITDFRIFKLFKIIID